MPRVKSADQIAALDRQKADLLAKLKENKSKAAAKKREVEDRRALIAGRAIIVELAEKPDGPEAAALRSVLSARLTRSADREAFGLPPLLAKAANQNPPPQAPAAPPEVIYASPPAPQQTREETAPRGPFDYPKIDPRHAVERIRPEAKPATPPVQAKQEPPAETKQELPAEAPSPGLLGALARAIQRPKT